jgi:hypothetical protein
MRPDRPPMPAGNGVSRRTALAGLIAALSAGCGKLAFMAANVPAAFGAHRRHADIAYGSHPRHRLDIYVPEPNSTADSAPRRRARSWSSGMGAVEPGDKAEYRLSARRWPNWVASPCCRITACTRKSNAGFHGRCARAGRCGGAACRRVWGGRESAVLDGSLGRRPLCRW